MAQATAIYTRISEDRAGEAAGVARQETDCRALAEKRGWPVVEVFCDNDIGAYRSRRRPAYRSRRRPAYQRMMTAIKDGTVDAVIVWHLDRLTRRPAELEEFFEICDAAGVKDLATCTGDVDLSTHDGRFMARILGAVARKESDDHSRRTVRMHQSLAEQGRSVGGGRPFGYEPDRVTIREGEADLIREAAERVIAGASVRSIAADWNRCGLKGPRGGRWAASSLRRVLMSSRIAGIRSYKGTRVAEGVWPAIIDVDTHRQVRAAIDARSTAPIGGVRARRYLLSGFAHCGKCGTRLIAQPRGKQQRTYACSSGPDLGGCGGIRVVAEPAEELVADQVLAWIDGPELAARIARADHRSDESELVGEIDHHESTLADLARDHYADGAISRGEFFAARQAVEGRLSGLRRRLARLRQEQALRPSPEGLEVTQAIWEGMEFERRRAVLELTIDRVVVHPHRDPARGKFDPDRIEIRWK